MVSASVRSCCLKAKKKEGKAHIKLWPQLLLLLHQSEFLHNDPSVLLFLKS